MAACSTGPAPLLDQLTRAAAATCDVPVAMVSLVDEHRLWFASSIGLNGLSELPRAVSFCAHTLLGDDLMEVHDASLDVRFADNPLVTGANGVRFYAGAPVILSDGFSLGALCVVDHAPKQLTDRQRTVLRHLAGAVAAALESAERVAQSTAVIEETTARIDDLYRSTPAPLFSMSMDGRLLVVSDTFLTETGYTRDELLGRPVFDLLTPESRASAQGAGMQRFLSAGRTQHHEYQLVRKDGVVIDVLVSQVLERDAVGRPLRSMGVFENITSRRRAEEALQAERARMARILEGTDAGTWELNVKTGETRYNERWAAIIGFTLAELGPTNRRTWLERIHPADVPLVLADARAHYAGESDSYHNECRIRHRDGSYVWVRDRGRVSERSADGTALWMHGTHEDINVRKRAEAALEDSQKFLERVGSVAGVGGWEIDVATRALSWSRQTALLHDIDAGYHPTLEEALRFFAPEVRAEIEAAIKGSIDHGTPFDLELPFVSAKGRAFWARLVGSIEYAHGEPVRLVGALQDVSRQKQMECDLARSRELLEVTLDSIGDAIVTTNNDGIVQWLNPVAERMTGWEKGEAVGRPLTQVVELVDDATRQPIPDAVASCLGALEVASLGHQVTLVSQSGAEFGVAGSASPIREAGGQVHGAVLVVRDVTEQRRHQREMSHRATHDFLTGLLNRSEFEARLATRIQAPMTDDVHTSLLYVDLDQFKLVNTACGHGAGDQLLRQVTAIFERCVRTADSVARIGGDEFGILLDSCSLADAQCIAQIICDEMDAFRFDHEGRRFRVGASIGLVPVDARWPSVQAVLHAADASCFAAKDGGRNRVHPWVDSDVAVKARHGDLQWVSRIELALDEDRFSLFAQRIEPIDGSRGGLHFEVLLRMLERDGKLVPPGGFLPIAERFHLATRIDRWVVRNAFDWLRTAGEQGVDVDMMSVNLSGQSLGDRAFHRDILQMIRLVPFDLDKLCFEITETAAVTHLDEARAFIVELRSLGVKIALDDFGAGASSFGYLKSLPVDFLKIDGHFVTNMLDDALDHAAVRCFCEVARVVGVKTIAEFVEREDVREELGVIGVDMAQGYLIHRPEPIEHLLLDSALVERVPMTA